LDKAEAHDNEQLMMGAVEGEPALGRGPAPDGRYPRHEYRTQSEQPVTKHLVVEVTPSKSHGTSGPQLPA
jgi:hypothetical protein